jgi:dTDP-4-dehydrorhamnose reductase
VTQIVISGGSGQVGRALQRCRWPSDAVVTAYERCELDIADADQVAAAIVPQIDFVINAAAYTAVDRAETDRDGAWRTNARGPAVLAARCAELGIPLLHLSTDYVFDGGKVTPYIEEDDTRPLNAYGMSKLDGEAAVRSGTPRHVIMRTASVFSEDGANFVKSMLRLGAGRPALRIVDDQISCPTAAADIAEALVRIVARIGAEEESNAYWGTYHFCGGPPVSWYDFAARIFEIAQSHGRTAPALERIRAAEFPSAARRPAHSAMDCHKIKEIFGIETSSWVAGLPQVLQAIIKEE